MRIEDMGQNLGHFVQRFDFAGELRASRVAVQPALSAPIDG
jgi:hypothetical protein